MKKVSLLVRTISAVLGWSLFFFWWKKVLGSAGLTQRTVLYSLIAIALTLLAAVVYSSVWIVHNKRVARRGQRGHVSFYKSPTFEKDAIGRTLELLPQAGGEPVIVVRTEANKKKFLAEQLALGAAQ